MLGRGESQLHHRQQAVAAGDDACVRPEPGETGERVVDAGRPLVLERSRDLHVWSPPPSVGRGADLAPRGEDATVGLAGQEALKRSVKRLMGRTRGDLRAAS